MKTLFAALFCLVSFTAVAHGQLREAEAQPTIEPDEPALQCLVDEGADFELTLNGQRYGCYALPDGSTDYVIIDQNGNQVGDTGLAACPASLPPGYSCCIAGSTACHWY